MKKFDLQDLKVQSFVTSFENSEEHTVKGGGTLAIDCSMYCSAVCTVASVNNTTCCLDTKVEAICKGWYTMPGWDGCGSFDIGF